ncbi:unnamed protein product [Rotaria socialis]|uniref:Uncharacterized protein n=1 Tax=Rotaria socialis TaxID=392032 RepID=A0A817RZD7_9BILA|nr:unnamed protein product [Rotaria socialis]CAF4401570.1 unnamed protein product [Rotaria socialis]
MSKENLVEFVASIIDEPSSEAISTANTNGDYNQSIHPSTPLPNISSGELEVNDIVVVASLNRSYRLARVLQLELDRIKVGCFSGPKYSIDMKKAAEYIICDEIILVLDKMSSLRSKLYSISDTDLNLILKHISKRRLLNEKLSDHDSIAEELITVKNELVIFGRTKTESGKFIQDMERILLGDNIKTKEGFHMVLNYAQNKTINITFEMIIISLINHVKKAFDIDSNAAVDDLAEFVAQACFFGKTIEIFYNMNIDDHSEKMKLFLRKCVAELATFMENQTEVQQEFVLRCFKMSSKIILNQLL